MYRLNFNENTDFWGYLLDTLPSFTFPSTVYVYGSFRPDWNSTVAGYYKRFFFLFVGKNLKISQKLHVPAFFFLVLKFSTWYRRRMYHYSCSSSSAVKISTRVCIHGYQFKIHFTVVARINKLVKHLFWKKNDFQCFLGWLKSAASFFFFFHFLCTF